MLRLGLALITSLTASLASPLVSSAFASENSSGVARSIKVRAAIVINGQSKNQSEVLLGDIAKFEGFTSQEVIELKKLNVTDAPQAGETRTFTGAALSQTFREQLKSFETDSSEKIALIVPSKVTISKKQFSLERADVEKELNARFKENCSACEFEFVQLNLPIIDTRGDNSASWSLRVRSELPRGSFSVPLEVSSTNHASKTYWVTGQVEIRKTVAVAKRNISIGDKINADDFAFESKNITYVTDGTPSEKELNTAFAARSIQADQVIGRSALRKESALRYGENVRVISGNKNWQISIEGVSQTNASVGDVVNVKISHTQKLVSGVLIDKGVVELR